MKKYWVVAKNTWEEMATYRFDFIIWRLRVVIQLLTMYFLWIVVIPASATIGDYSHSAIITYILGTSFISAVALSSRTQEIGENINSGDLSIFLIRPINYFGYWFWRDIGDKATNIVFSLIEMSILFFILKPPFFWQTNLIFLAFTLMAIAIALILYFLVSSLLGLVGFWSADVWAPRFIFFMLLSFFTGWFFPLDILPKTIFNILEFLPFSYLMYFPLKIYLGQLSTFAVAKGFIISLVWIGILYKSLQLVWLKGLKVYTAQGR